MTNWEEYVAAPGNLFRPELNHVYAHNGLTHYWFTLTELLTGGEKKNTFLAVNAFAQFHLSVSVCIYICAIHSADIYCRPKVLGRGYTKANLSGRLIDRKVYNQVAKKGMIV